MTSFRRWLRKPRGKYRASWTVLGSALLAICTGVAIWQLGNLRRASALKHAEEQLAQGRGALAAESLAPFKESLSKTEKGCKVLISAHEDELRSDHLGWVAESCLESGIDLPEVWLGYAKYQAHVGNEPKAIAILLSAKEKDPKNVELRYHAGHLLMKARRFEEAASELDAAVRLAPGSEPVSLLLIDALSALERWDRAGEVAESIAAVNSDDPEVRLLVATALVKSGRRPRAEAQIAQAQILIDDLDEVRKREITKRHGEILSLIPPDSSAKAIIREITKRTSQQKRPD